MTEKRRIKVPTNVFAKGETKEDFLVEMSNLWDCLEQEKINDVIGFEYHVGEVITVTKILHEKVEK